MNDKLEEIIFDNEAESLFCRTPGLNNPETYVLTHYRFNTYMVLILSDLNKVQINKISNRDQLHHEVEKIMSFSYLIVFKAN